MVRKACCFLWCILLLRTALAASGNDPALVLAVSDFTGEHPALCQAVTETVLTDLAKSRRLTLVERAQLRHALGELRLQKAGLTETGEMARAGKMVGATHVVVGSVSVNEQRVILNARVLDVRTGTLYAGAAVNTEGWRDELFALAHELANALHYRLTGENLPGFAQTSQTPAVVDTSVSPEPTAVDRAPAAPDWENLPESAAIAQALVRGWMRLYPDGSFRPRELVTERYFYETLRRLARRYGKDDTRYFHSGEGSIPVSRLQAARIVGAMVQGRAPYFLEAPEWATGWLGNTAHKPMTRAQFAHLLQLAEEQLQRRITPDATIPSVMAGGR
ncbi:MAG: CsgG/HfaB family protein [bacterium]|nr:CsgG/HfaB family protein [bacterium]